MISPDRDDLFYNRLEPFQRFSGIVDLQAYRPVPADWIVLITDVRGSTDAIGDGRYKDVNMVGAASITAVLNVRGDIEVPFVFGGDGASLVVPGALAPAASAALVRLQQASRSMFGLHLRVGAIPVSDLRGRGVDVRIRKYALSPGNHLAMFSGHGLERADALIKDPAGDNPYLLRADADPEPPDLAGLSCRWQPLETRNGRMMSLLIQPAETGAHAEGEELAAVLDRIAAILGHGLDQAAPVDRRALRFRWPPEGLLLEARATRGRRPLWLRLAFLAVESALQAAAETFGRRIGDYDPPAYREELQSNTDFRKFDGVLRAVLDVSSEQAAAIERYLDCECHAGRLVYGAHTSARALMTCVVFSLARSEHIHFIDGSDGGFAMAAADLKRRASQS